ncbi:hypothetical protein [Ruegeria arenilitoris]|uniref:hypothetical protein n=1 Tax=Ruegeria arenilitoris TaxID=1173585 RepID=UPI00147DD666|nr:hypothetical protein [Ruegeria arenilitoris]
MTFNIWFWPVSTGKAGRTRPCGLVTSSMELTIPMIVRVGSSRMTWIRMVSMRPLRFISKQCARGIVGLFRVPVLAGLVFGASPVAADLVSPYGGETAPNFVELSVEDDHVRATLEIDLSDYPIFVVPEDGSNTSLAERTGQNFHILADGEELQSTTQTIDVRPRVLRQTAASTLVAPRPRSEKVVFVDMVFPFQGKPERITFTPPLNPDGLPLASIGVVAEHMDVPVTDYRYLSQAETMLPDWGDPWFTKFENPNLTRHHKSPMMSFLAMEPRVVRHEIIFRLKDLEKWTNLGLGEAERLTADQVADIKATASKFFSERNPITIDGAQVKPDTVQVSRIEVGAEGLRLIPDQAEANRNTMLMGVVLSYPTTILPARVDMTWELFPDGLEIIPVTLSDPAGAVPSQIYQSDPSVSWNNHLTTWQDPRTAPVIVKTAGLAQAPLITIGLGLLALVCAGLAGNRTARQRYVALGIAGALGVAAAFAYPIKHSLPMMTEPQPDEVASHQVIEGLLTNISTAMLETQNDKVTAALEPFVEEGNRDDVRAEMRRGLSVTLPSGALARVEDISDLNVESFLPEGGKNQHQVLANWTARVSGGHWGHLHRRAVFYRGMFNVSRHGERWKLDGLTILSAKTEG